MNIRIPKLKIEYLPYEQLTEYSDPANVFFLTVHQDAVDVWDAMSL